MTATIEGVKQVLAEVLGPGLQVADFDERTALLDRIPELDSMAVLEILAQIEARFGVVIDDLEVSGDIFETLGSLTRFVDSKLDRT